MGKHPDRYRQENWEPVFPGEERIVGDVLRINGHDDILEFLFVIFFARHTEYSPRLGHSLLFYQPAGAAGDAEEQQQEKRRRQGRDAKLPPPFSTAKLHRSHNEVREISE